MSIGFSCRINKNQSTDSRLKRNPYFWVTYLTPTRTVFWLFIHFAKQMLTIISPYFYLLTNKCTHSISFVL